MTSDRVQNTDIPFNRPHARAAGACLLPQRLATAVGAGICRRAASRTRYRRRSAGRRAGAELTADADGWTDDRTRGADRTRRDRRRATTPRRADVGGVRDRNADARRQPARRPPRQRRPTADSRRRLRRRRRPTPAPLRTTNVDPRAPRLIRRRRRSRSTRWASNPNCSSYRSFEGFGGRPCTTDGRRRTVAQSTGGGDDASRRRMRRRRRRAKGGATAVAAGDFVPNEIIIEVDGAVTEAQAIALAQRHRLTRVESQNFPLIGATMFRWRIPDRRSIDTVARQLLADGSVRSVQRNYRFALAAGRDGAGRSRPVRHRQAASDGSACGDQGRRRADRGDRFRHRCCTSRTRRRDRRHLRRAALDGRSAHPRHRHRRRNRRALATAGQRAVGAAAGDPRLRRHHERRREHLVRAC